jgi:hypothetical protein
MEFELDHRLSEAENIGVFLTVPILRNCAKLRQIAPRFETIGCRIGVTTLVESKLVAKMRPELSWIKRLPSTERC